MTALELRDVHRVHGTGDTAVNGVSLTVAPGERVSVMDSPAPAGRRC